LAISEKDRLEPVIMDSGLAINSDRFVNLCLKTNLKIFIENNHSDGQYVFWPDLASAH
jgi:hypothetical protein